ncbi:MAG: DUF402 domain-containing protein [bacterium]
MNREIVGTYQLIHCYKHDGSPHRSWSNCLVLEETDDYFIVVNDHTLVTESDGRRWYTREPAVCFFPKHEWYNVICMIRKQGVYYYCNIASPTLFDGEAFKYIDYDLDLKVFPNYHYKILDEGEYQAHRQLYDYPERLDTICRTQLEELIKMTLNMEGPFRPGFVEKWYSNYQNLMNHEREND